jgi:hypothetical protein
MIRNTPQLLETTSIDGEIVVFAFATSTVRVADLTDEFFQALGINRDPWIFPFADVALEKQSKREGLSMKDGLHRS